MMTELADWREEVALCWIGLLEFVADTGRAIDGEVVETC